MGVGVTSPARTEAEASTVSSAALPGGREALRRGRTERGARPGDGGTTRQPPQAQSRTRRGASSGSSRPHTRLVRRSKPPLPTPRPPLAASYLPPRRSSGGGPAATPARLPLRAGPGYRRAPRRRAAALTWQRRPRRSRYGRPGPPPLQRQEAQRQAGSGCARPGPPPRREMPGAGGGGSSASPDPPLLPTARRVPSRLLPQKFPFLRGEEKRGGRKGAQAATAAEPSLTAQQTRLSSTGLRHRLDFCAFPRCRRGARRRRPPRRRPQTPPQRPARRCPLSGRGARRRRRSRPLPAPVLQGGLCGAPPPHLLLRRHASLPAAPPGTAKASPDCRIPTGPQALSSPGERGRPSHAGPGPPQGPCGSCAEWVSAAAGLGHQGGGG